MPPQPPTPSVLLVDDNANNLLVLESLLGGMGLDLVSARSGEEALRRVLDRDFAAILMDVQMPGIDGLEAAELIRRRDKSRHTPIIFLTAFQSDEVQVARGYALGAVDFLGKPVMPAALRAKVAVFVDLYRKAEQVRRQAEQLVETERREHGRELVEQRRQWELERLRQEAAREKAAAEALAQKAEELARTIEQRAHAEQELARTRDELAAQLSEMTRLHALGASLSASLELPEVLAAVVEAVASLQGSDRGVLLLPDGEGGPMAPVASLGFTPEELADAAGTGPEPWPAADLAHAFEPDAGLRLPPALLGWGGAPCLTPLVTAGGRTVGLIATFFPRPHRPSPREARTVELYARQAAAIIDNARLHRAIREADRHKGEFLATLAHELRNPLAPLLHALELLRLGEADRDAAEQAREIAERQARHLARLVDDLLDVSRISSGKIQLRKGPMDLRAAVARGLEAASPLVEARRHVLTSALPEEPVLLHADAARVEQVLANLLTNAAKYTEPGGRIDLSVDVDGDEAVIRVRDTGIGIAPEMLPRVFDLFAQADRALGRSQGGLGIGLTLVRRLVELHGGSVAAASPGEGLGCEFVVRLPAGVDGPAAEAGPSPSENGAVDCRPRRVLLVDDNVDGASTLARLLRASGHEVRVAHEGLSALELAREQPPEIVLLDIGMPGMDGYQVARALRELPGPDRAVLIALTGYGQEDDRRRTREAGFDHHLVKPVDLDELLRLLGRPTGPRACAAAPEP